MPAVLEVRDVSRRIGAVQVLDRVSFALEGGGGSIVALLGPSGAGKTQLLDVLAGLRRPDAGEVVGPDGAPVEAGSVGLVLQSHPLLRHRTVLQNLLLAGKVGGMTAADARARATRLLERLRLRERADAFPSQLSGGERQRAAVAQQLVRGKRLLLLDEPFSGLDPAATREVQRLLRALVASGEIETILFVTHDVRAALQGADEILVLGPAHGLDRGGARIQARYDLRAPDRPDDAALERAIERYFARLWQVHDKFRLFGGLPGPDGGLGALGDEVARFAGTVAARSVGARYLSRSGQLLLTLGYREDEAPYPIRLVTFFVEKPTPAAVEAALRSAARGGRVLCHDLFATAGGRVAGVVMTLADS